MVKRTFKYSSATLEKTSILKIFNGLDSRAKSFNKKDNYYSLEFSAILRDGTTLETSNSNEVANFIEDEIKNIRKIKIRLYSANLNVDIDEGWDKVFKPIEVRIAAATSDNLVVVHNMIERELLKEKNWNWVPQNEFLVFVFSGVISLATIVVIVNAILSKPLSDNANSLAWILATIFSGIVGFMTAWLLRSITRP